MADRQKRVSNTNVLSAESESAEFWEIVSRLQSRVDLGDYKHLVLGLLFLRAKTLESSSVISTEKSWRNILSADGSVQLLSALDQAFIEISAKIGFSFLEDFRRGTVDSDALRELLLAVDSLSDGPLANKRIMEAFSVCLEAFSHADGKGGSECSTPKCIADLLIKATSPTRGSLYDPCCGSGGLLAHAALHAQQSGSPASGLKLFGQESNPSTWRLCNMNLGIRGVKYNLGARHADTFRTDLHPSLKAEFVLANPPFNLENWCTGEAENQTWTFGDPPHANANFAWIQTIIRHLSPHGIAAFTMGNGALSSTLCGEGEIRRRILEADYVDCIISLPSNLFHSTRIPASIWILAQEKSEGLVNGQQFRARHRQTLFIDATRMGRMTDRIHRTLDEDEIQRVAGTYRAWRGSDSYADASGFCYSCDTREIAANDYLLTPNRYVGGESTEPLANDSPTSVDTLIRKLKEQFRESTRLEAVIRDRLMSSGYEI